MSSEKRPIVCGAVTGTSNLFGCRVFEVKLLDANNEVVARMQLPLPLLKDAGVATTLNSTRRVRDWMKSEDGREWLNTNYKKPLQMQSPIPAIVRTDGLPSLPAARPESVRKKLPSLTPDEVVLLHTTGVRWFHNAGTRRRYLSSCLGWAMYKRNATTRSVTGIPLYVFASWAKGAVLKDGTVWVKGDAPNLLTDRGIIAEEKDVLEMLRDDLKRGMQNG